MRVVRRIAQPVTLIALAILLVLVLGAIVVQPWLTQAVHETSNTLAFAPIDDSPSPDGSGEGIITFNGQPEPDSQWTVRFQVDGLEPNTPYVIAVQGRFGEDDTPEATAFSEICTFRTDDAGRGTCWNYIVGLRRLSIVEVRLGDENGATVLQASRGPSPGAGALDRSPGAPTAIPLANAAPQATPIATPEPADDPADS